ncbi:hypothetical protein EGW08_013093 [Elysia chlorotica]|uniref:Glycolipid transfer protein domain-containing protein n=1 Tax=Elysia chlorotica TaxID=188477 RepID=A0A433TC65_ELYCH|nr:hypothetical protein EGW08_013093 [Elysia chlorotica]
MSAATGESLFSGKTSFSNIAKFPPIGKDKVIQTEPFLDACTGVVSILDNLGTAFSVPKKDVLGNIKKISECYQTNPGLYKTLNVFLENKKCTAAVLWLKRALEFLLAFIDSLVRDHSSGVEKENLRNNILQAYEPTLKQYHGRMTQFVFSNIARLVPHRTEFLKAMMTDSDAKLDMVFNDLSLYIPDFKSNISTVGEMLVLHNLDEQKVV